ncbi:hypothetical protein QN277_016115 [Acacia crassicarpa]|uniref:BED-type domain-containing protein n=1 Tax=Acacia crassicarpa TaxID=499986 RepID=A0AAE1MW02_9FABA|nr:hypothetical protein QN277_016115 [Acacia crassicarpa]
MASSAGANNDAIATSYSRGIKMKNAIGSRTDLGWKHGVEVDGNGRKIQCNYCKKTITGGVYRFKHHLVETQKDVGAYSSVPEKVRKEMFGIVSSLQETNEETTTSTEVDDGDELDGKRK